jgi:hypothetical protein
MAQTVASGAFAYCNYGFETTEGTVAASMPRPFGNGVKITIDRKNNMEKIYGLGARNATANVAKKFEGSATIDFELGAGNALISDGGASWLRAAMGAIPTDGGATPYTHTYAESNTLAAMSISAGVELGTNDAVTSLIGAKVASMKINSAVNEVATVTLTCPYRTETLANSGISTQVAPNETPLTFAQGVLQVNGTTVGYVQSIELTLTNNVDLIWGLGSRYATASTQKTRVYDVKMSVVFSDTALLLEKFFGKAASIAATDLATLNPAGVALVLTFDNGLATSNQRAVIFTFANFYIDAHSLPLSVDDVIKEDVTGHALSCTSVVVKNAQATDVASP